MIVNVLEKHYLDRDLTRSGNSVVMITAGQGVFNVDGKLSGEFNFLLPAFVRAAATPRRVFSLSPIVAFPVFAPYCTTIVGGIICIRRDSNLHVCQAAVILVPAGFVSATQAVGCATRTLLSTPLLPVPSAITTQRMMDNGIGMDMVSLSGPPIHTAPLFISKRLVKETVPLAPANGKPPLQQQEISRQEAVTAAALLARQFSQQPQLQQQYGGTVSAAAATTTAARSRRSPSLNSEEVLVQETPKYEVMTSPAVGHVCAKIKWCDEVYSKRTAVAPEIVACLQ